MRRLKVTMVPLGTTPSVHLVRQPAGESSLVSHQKIASFSFGVATKTSYAMLPGIIGNRHRQVHLATFGRETNLFDEAVLHDPGGTGTLQTRRISAAETTDRRSLHRWWCHPTHPAEPATG
ncbi:Uncharacterised protein [Mycobacteroides abscessus subsp. abscessus]|nr:Uncharacterised protein [Mycobacteroides abscessus subsp. abscessus]